MTRQQAFEICEKGLAVEGRLDEMKERMEWGRKNCPTPFMVISANQFMEHYPQLKDEQDDQKQTH